MLDIFGYIANSHLEWTKSTTQQRGGCLDQAVSERERKKQTEKNSKICFHVTAVSLPSILNLEKSERVWK